MTEGLSAPTSYVVIPRAQRARGNPSPTPAYRTCALSPCHSEGAARPWESVPISCQQRPKAATYLCRSAAKARFDNRQPPEGVSKEGGPQPSLFGRSRMGDFQGGRKIETSFPLEWRSLVTFFRQGKKVTRRRQNKKQKSLISPQKNNGALAPLFFVHFRCLTPRPRPHQRGSAAHGWTGRSSASPRRWP